jgi:hypothetical protein
MDTAAGYRWIRTDGETAIFELAVATRSMPAPDTGTRTPGRSIRPDGL